MDGRKTLKSRLGRRNLFAVLVCAAVLGMIGTALGEEILPDSNYPAFEEPNHAERPEYVENEIIVKFRGNSADAIETGVAEGIAAHELKLSDSLDKLNKKYKLKRAKPLFKNFKENREQVKALLGKDKALLSKKERHILRRLKRAPKDAKVPDLSRIYQMELELEPGQSLQEVVAAYQSNPDVEYAELNYIVSICKTPDDLLYPIQWPLNNTGQDYPKGGSGSAHGTVDCDIDAPEAWEINTGSSEVLVAIVDTGVDYRHRDLDGNMWVNEVELAGAEGVDDDGNGYIDDVYGYDFINNDEDPKDDHGHGTHCSGIIAAEGDNGLEIAGVCWNARIMAVKFLGWDGYGTITDAAKALYYAVENGADVVSNSWGDRTSIGGLPALLIEAFDYAHDQGVITVAAAGNDGREEIYYPACFDHVISVAATDSDDAKASFSNYGDWVDIAAPGVDVLSLRARGTSMGTTYDDYTTIASGTSMACPHVSGACALMLSIYPGMQIDEVTDILLKTTDPIAPNICVSGRLNLFEAMQVVANFVTGVVNLDRDAYSCSDTVQITVRDLGIKGKGTQGITVTADGGDLETVTLAETNLSSGKFTGMISTEVAAPTIEDGTLQISHGQTITVTYNDQDHGGGNSQILTDTAIVDCNEPVILNVQAICQTGSTASITFETDELTTGRVYYATNCGGPYTITAGDKTLATSHRVYLSKLNPETNYYLAVEAIDAAGNETLDDNSGACYSFVTKDALHVPADYATIQSAIDAAFHYDVVLVANGTYTGEGNRNIDFKGKAITVRSKNGPENCIIDCEGLGPGFFFLNGEDANSILDGFTITRGHTHWRGGGILCYDSAPTIVNCIVSNNIGGGINREDNWEFGGSQTIANCIISDNIGGGINCRTGGTVTITDCTISGNSGNQGAGLQCESASCRYGGTFLITNCTISENKATSYSGGRGGGISLERTMVAVVKNCKITSNSTQGIFACGGGISCLDSSPTIANCLISGNSADYNGGGIYCRQYSVPAIVNCTITDNSADGGGGVCCYVSSIARIKNSVLWANNAPKGPEIYLRDGNNEARLSYTDIQGGQGDVYIDNDSTLNWGNGNIEVDPHFAFDSDYHIMPDSPCVDTGDPNYMSEPNETDLDGNPRVINGRIDMGAYEYNPNYPSIAVSPSTLNFSYAQGQRKPKPQTLLIRNCGGEPLQWEIHEDCDWLRVSQIEGHSTSEVDEVTLRVDPHGLEMGHYSCTLTVSAVDAANAPQIVKVALLVGREIIYVPSDVPVIQEAVEYVLEGGKVIVEDGTYTGDGNRDIDFHGKAITVKSENGPENCIIDCNGTKADIHRGFYFHSGEDANSILDGFTITNGYTDYKGAAIMCTRSSPTITNCIIAGNSGPDDGGILCHARSNPTIHNCTFIGNSGLWTSGIRCTYNSNPVITNCIFTEGDSTAITTLFDSNPIVSNCLIFANYFTNFSAAIRIYQGCDGTKINNCLVTGNYSTGWAAGIWCSMSKPTITNCTIIGNSSDELGGGIGSYDANPTIRNCIIRDNETPDSPQIVLKVGGAASVSYSNVTGGWEGEGNIDADPCFVAPGYWDANGLWVEGNYHLLEDSPCIDAGDPNFIPEPNETDIDGNARIVDGDSDGNSVVDMGAYEYRPPTPAELIAELLEGVGGLELPRGIENGLEVKLNAALGALEDENENNDIAAINTLGAFINAVEAQRGKKIPEAEADALIAAAREIIELLRAE